MGVSSVVRQKKMTRKSNEGIRRWRKEFRRFWRSVHNSPVQKAPITPRNVARMKKGQPPQSRWVLKSTKTGKIVTRWVSVELHHIFPINLYQPMDEQCYIELWPWEHSAIDPSRHFPWLPVKEIKC